MTPSWFAYNGFGPFRSAGDRRRRLLLVRRIVRGLDETVRRVRRMTDMDEHLRRTAAGALLDAGVRIGIGRRAARTAAAHPAQRGACHFERNRTMGQ